MKSSIAVFLAAFVAFSAAWAGFVLAPQLQLGLNSQVKPTSGDNLYPLARPGLAQQGAEVYRSLGCAYCHSQTVRQESTICEVTFTEPGTNAAAAIKALALVDADLAHPGTFGGLPKLVKTVANVPLAQTYVKALASGGGKASIRVVPVGGEITRGWGIRQSVAQDYAFDHPALPGSRRLGPDLTNVGARRADANWQLLHLYAPAIAVPGSTMPPYRFLFEQRKTTPGTASQALQLPPEIAPPAGFEIVPTDAARALAAYLVSLRVDAPLLEAPYTAATPAPAATNAPAVTPAP